MATTMSLPFVAGNRPAYALNLFRDSPNTPSITYSSTSSFSCNSALSGYDLPVAYNAARPLSPPPEKDNSDIISTRSKRSFLSRHKFRLGTVLHRRTYPQSNGMDSGPRSSSAKPPTTPPASPPAQLSSSPVSVPVMPDMQPAPRRPSLPKLQTNFPPPRAISTYAKKPLPAVPGQKQADVQAPLPARPRIERQKSNSSAGELSCQRCYYSAARNCQGWVLGGEVGDPCEGCLQAGFFGAI